MVAYMEEEELIPGKIYYCEDYIGNNIILEYIGNGEFEDEKFIYCFEGDVRYVFREIEK